NLADPKTHVDKSKLKSQCTPSCQREETRMVKHGWKRPETARLVVILSRQEVEEIDRFGMGAQLPSRSATVRKLIANGLQNEKAETAPTVPAERVPPRRRQSQVIQHGKQNDNPQYHTAGPAGKRCGGADGRYQETRTRRLRRAERGNGRRANAR